MLVQTEANLVHWLVTVILPIAIAGASFYFSSQSRSSRLEHRITKLEVVNHEQEKIIESHNRRLDKHEEEQKITLALVQRMDHLNENIGDLKEDLAEIKKLVDQNMKI